MESLIHGFSPKEVVDLYRYLCIYESELGKVAKLEVFKQQYPKLKRLDNLMSSFVCNECNIEALSNIGIVPMDNLLSMTYSKSSKLLSLLYHLRNSIAHGQIEQENGFVFIIDYKKDYKKGNGIKRFSARGKINSTTLFEIIGIINENINL